MVLPTVYGVPILLLVGCFTVFLQVVIQLLIRSRAKNVYQEFFYFTEPKQVNIWIKITFFYNPLNWGGVKDKFIRGLLVIHFTVATPLVIVLLIPQLIM